MSYSGDEFIFSAVETVETIFSGEKKFGYEKRF
jgi:hypothetical protein